MALSVSGGKFLASTSTIVTTELHICDFKRFDDSARRGLRWKYCGIRTKNNIDWHDEFYCIMTYD